MPWMTSRWLVAALLLLIASPASGQWKENGRAAPDEPWRRSDGSFGAMLFLTRNLKGFQEQWAKPASHDYQPRLDPTEEGVRGETVSTVVLFHGCTAGLDRRCNAEATFRLLRPDGSLYGQHTGVLWRSEPPPAPNLQMSAAHMAFEIELDDPLGTYRVEVIVLDRVSGRTLKLVRPLAVSDVPASSRKRD
jgi:hypothetical protein